MRQLIGFGSTSTISDQPSAPPRLLVQYWDDKAAIPSDVQGCIDSWAPLEQVGFERLLFDDASAIDFIYASFGPRYVSAFEKCEHPAMRADYFRLCFIASRGGLYVDADDVYSGESIEALFNDGRLKLNPLCYDISDEAMLDPILAAKDDDDLRIFYVNNNPLIAPKHHPVIEKALERSTAQLLSGAVLGRDIQSLTGPGNLTATVVEHALNLQQTGHDRDFDLLENWDAIARSEWSLAYRSDQRNWRHWVRETGGRS